VYLDVDGSPYFIDGFRYANAISQKGAEFGNLKIKIDLFKQEVHVISQDNAEIIAQDGLFKDIVLADTVSNAVLWYWFQTGLPAIDKNNTNSLYQVLSGGKIHFLKFTMKQIVETKDVMSGEVKKEFIPYSEFYVYREGVIRKLKKEKDFILEQVKDHASEIETWLEKKKINFRNIVSLTALFDFYNSLSPVF
jgi:hypothetical protein